ncbi:MAG: hypothetical protein HRU30_10525 [Rhodobacteraceae bacterium]|nr:hypothetical protein [Paracoccaceae bacterium]
MANLLQLYLPALIPSWRFFEEIGPSPRIDIRVNDGPWREYRCLPKQISPFEALRRMVWNPDWTEHLYLVSRAERLTAAPNDHALDDMINRLTRIAKPSPEAVLQFRLRFLTRENGTVENHIAYESRVWRVDDV